MLFGGAPPKGLARPAAEPDPDPLSGPFRRGTGAGKGPPVSEPVAYPGTCHAERMRRRSARMMMRGLWARRLRGAAAMRLAMLLAATAVMTAFAGSPAVAGGARRATEIQVAGQAELRVNPDVATVVLTVETQAESAPLAQEANATRVAVIRAALEELG